MINWNKRKEEIINIWNNLSKRKPLDILVFIDTIIFQEKEMIKQRDKVIEAAIKMRKGLRVWDSCDCPQCQVLRNFDKYMENNK